MAMADYYLCDKCGSKTFYDANLHYEDDEKRGYWLFGAGDIAVLCVNCAKTHRVKIVEND